MVRPSLDHGSQTMVLLAERNAAVREWLLRLVRSAGHTVECFAGGQSLLERLGKKPVRPELLLEAIATGLACARKLAVSRRQLAEVAMRFEELTRRERQVFALVTSGRVNKEVAVDLEIAVKTVKVHRARVMQKMQAPSLAHLVRMASLVIPEAP